MDADQDPSSKTEEPTLRRLDKAREEGQVLRSQDFTVALMLMVGAGTLWASAQLIVEHMLGLLHRPFQFGSEVVHDTHLMTERLGGAVFGVAVPLLIVFAATLMTAVLAPGLFGGIHFSFKAVQPRFNKLNPLAGLRRMFSLRSLFELAKGLLKTAVIGVAIFLTVRYFLPHVLMLNVVPTAVGLRDAGRIVLVSTVLISASLWLIAALDMPYQYQEFRNKLRMSKQEIKDEYKETEGRPEIKQRIRQRQREIAMGKMMKAIETADVVITNPDHFAVALSYTPGSSEAPKVVAKGVDFLAQRIKDKARANNIPLFEAPALARALYFSTRLNDCIPETLYVTVAEVIAYIFNLSAFRQRPGGLRRPQPTVPRSMLYSTDGQLLHPEDSP